MTKAIMIPANLQLRSRRASQTNITRQNTNMRKHRKSTNSSPNTSFQLTMTISKNPSRILKMNFTNSLFRSSLRRKNIPASQAKTKMVWGGRPTRDLHLNEKVVRRLSRSMCHLTSIRLKRRSSLWWRLAEIRFLNKKREIAEIWLDRSC